MVASVSLHVKLYFKPDGAFFFFFSVVQCLVQRDCVDKYLFLIYCLIEVLKLPN